MTQHGCMLNLRTVTTETVFHKLQIGKLRVHPGIRDVAMPVQETVVRNMASCSTSCNCWGGHFLEPRMEKSGACEHMIGILNMQIQHCIDSEIPLLMVGLTSEKLHKSTPARQGRHVENRTLGGSCKRDAKMAESMKTCWKTFPVATDGGNWDEPRPWHRQNLLRWYHIDFFIFISVSLNYITLGYMFIIGLLNLISNNWYCKVKE